MTQNNSDEVQARQALAEREDAMEVVGWLKQFRLGRSDAVLVATLQAIIGFSLIALVDGPLSLLGYAFATASVLMFWRMKYVLVEFDRQNRCSED